MFSASSMHKMVIHTPSIELDGSREIFRQEGIQLKKTTEFSEKLPPNTFTVFIIEESDLSRFMQSFNKLLLTNGIMPVLLIISVNPTELLLTNKFVADILQPPYSRNLLLYRIRQCFFRLQTQYEKVVVIRELQIKSRELKELSGISSLLMMEKDLGKLLNQILLKSREITQSDAGSLYLVEENETGDKLLRFKWTQNDSIQLPWQEFTFPLSTKSIAGYVALTGQMLNIEDAYFIPPDREYSLNRSFDEKTGYRTKSILIVPLKNHKDEIIGVLQLINRKRSFETKLASKEIIEEQIVSFDKRCEELINAFAGQAAVSIENNFLYQSIEHLFEGFVKAAVTAIESRDPTTSGHSNRVALLTSGLAELVDRCDKPKFRDTKFTREHMKEIRYASLLHDFGKVGVREQVLLKAKKLYPYHLHEILDRFRYIRRSMEFDSAQKKIECLIRNGNQDYRAKLLPFEEELERQLNDLDIFVRAILEANEPTVLESDTLQKIEPLLGKMYKDVSGEEISYLAPAEFTVLSIKKGSLNTEERLEIESHVTHTFKFLRLVPWTKDITNIPIIAYAHHEKLNGEGYPGKLNRYQIPLQSKMMTISDIFDALTASDRPYKRAVPTEKALNILKFEVKDDHVDQDLLDIFIEGKVFDRVLSQTG